MKKAATNNALSLRALELLLGLLIALLCISPVFSLAATKNLDENRLFSPNGEPLAVTLTGPWSEIARDRSPKPAYRRATLASEGDHALEVRVRPRGKSRRKKEFCDFPPLRLNFSKGSTRGSRFEHQNKLKMVTHCGRLGVSSKRYSDQLQSEFLLYRILSELTETSFRVQRLDVTWVDTKNNATYQHPAFFIEHKTALVKRLGGTELKAPRIAISELDPEYAALTALFAYFAGNTDFSFTQGATSDGCCHNALPIVVNLNSDSATGVRSIPYDFDSTGFVNPAYATPVAGVGIKTVSQRIHRGYCAHAKEVPHAIERFISARDSIFTLLSDYPDISERRRKQLLRYTDGFYRVLASDKQRKQKLIERCR